MHDSPDRGASNAVLLGQSPQITATNTVWQSGANSQHIAFRQDVHPVALPLSKGRIDVTWMTFADGATTLGRSVVDVVLLRAQPQMTGTNAQRYVADVQNHEAIRDRSVGQLPSHAMRAAGGTVDDRPSVARSLGTSPQPAIARLVDAIPERNGTLSHLQYCTSRAA